MHHTENQSWIVNVGGDVVEKQAAVGFASLTSLERLIYCLWVADYGMRNAGDLETAADVYPSFLEDGRKAAVETGLPRSIAAFSLSSATLEQQYFDLFEPLVDELREAS